MDCKKCKEKLSEYSDNQLNKKETMNIKMHLEECKECKKEFDELNILKEIIKELPMKELPESFEAELHEKLMLAHESNEKQNKNKFFLVKKHINRNVKRYSLAVAACLIIMVSYNTANQNSYYKSDMVSPQASEMVTMTYEETSGQAPVLRTEEAFGNDYEMEKEVFNFTNDEFSNDSVESTPSVKVGKAIETGSPEFRDSKDVDGISLSDNTQEKSRKIIQSAYLSMDIVDYDGTLDQIIDMTLSMGGYIDDMSSSYQYGYRTENPLKMGHVTIRVPQQKFHGVIKGLDEYGKVTDQSLSSEDITSQYRDIANEVANLEVRETKLREIMDKAVEIKDVLEIERELSRVRGEINNMKGTLIQWDQLVSLSRITINLYEVESLEVHIEPIDDSLIKRISDEFISSINSLRYSLENLVLVLVAILPFIIGYSVIGFIGWKIVKKLFRRIKNWRK